MSYPQTPLAKAMPRKMDAEKIKRLAWLDDGMLVVSREDGRLDMVEKEFVNRIGNYLYGERK